MKQIIYILLIALSFQSCELIFNKQNAKKIIEETKPQKPKSLYRDGLIVKKYDNGKTKTEINYTDGYKNGVAKEYYPDGNIKAVYHYNYDHKNGLVSKYYTSGQIKWELNFNDNKKNGVLKQYYVNGKLKSKQSFVRGIPLPDLEEYKKDGSLITKYPEFIIDKNIERNGDEVSNTLILHLSYGNERTKFYSETIDTNLTIDYKMFIITKEKGHIVTITKGRKWHNKKRILNLTAIYKTKFDNYKLYYKTVKF